MKLTKHHLWWPRRNYRTKLEVSFRSHPLNRIYLEESVHEHLHAEIPPPPKPPVEYMKHFLEMHGQSGRNTNKPGNQKRQKEKKQ